MVTAVSSRQRIGEREQRAQRSVEDGWTRTHVLRGERLFALLQARVSPAKQARADGRRVTRRDEHQPLVGAGYRPGERAQEAQAPPPHRRSVDQNLERLAGGSARRVDDEIVSMPAIVEPRLHARCEQVALAHDR